MPHRSAFALCASLILAAPALASPNLPALEHELSGIERAPSAEAILRFGEGVDRALVELAGRQPTRLSQVRAIYALRFCPGPIARAFLLAELSADERARGGAAVLRLSAALGSLVPYGAGVLPTLAPFVDHASPMVRLGAVAALRALKLPAAQTALRARLSVETDTGVARALRAALTQVAR